MKFFITGHRVYGWTEDKLLPLHHYHPSTVTDVLITLYIYTVTQVINRAINEGASSKCLNVTTPIRTHADDMLRGSHNKYFYFTGAV